MIPTREQWRNWSLPSRLTAVGTYIAILSLCITAALLLIDNIRLRGESVYLQVGEFVDDIPIDIREGYGNHLGWQLTYAFPVTFINDGLKPATVTNYDLIPLNCSYQYTFRGQDGDQGLFGSASDPKPLVLPFAIGPGEGRTVFLKTAIVVTLDTAVKADDLKEGSTVRDLMLEVIAREKGFGLFESEDFFGNPVEYGIGVRGLVDFDLMDPDSINQPVYKLVIHTARGHTFDTLFAPYPVQKTSPFTRDCGEEPFDKKPTLQLKSE